jgi:chemotaxis signal transduction protein
VDAPRTPADSPATAPRRDAASELLARAPIPEYLAAWGRSLQKTLFDEGRGDQAGLVFRLGEERYLLPAACLREVHRACRVHRVPGRTHDLFRGLACLRGELVLCANLHGLLGVTPGTGTQGGAGGAAAPEDVKHDPPAKARMVVIEQSGARWAFEADEVLDVRRYAERKVAAPQVTVAKAAVHFTDGLVDLGDVRAARLDTGRLFAGLARSLA